ncbi:MAG: hypothetical protein AABY87_11410 [bacterium]
MSLGQGCARLRPAPGYGEEVFITHPVGGLPVTIRYLPADAPILPLVEESIRSGMEKAGRWGEIRSAFTVTVYPDHKALEKAVHKEGYKWLKAWATEEAISLQSPRSWPVFRDKYLFDLMAHELTHVVCYQTAGIRASRSSENAPFWFGEGLASVTAGQGYRRYSRKVLLRKLRSDRAFDPLSPAEKDIRDREKLVYSSAHYLVTYLIETCGEERVRDLLHRITLGDSFMDAFDKTYPFPLKRLRSEWESWLEMNEN